MIKVAMIGIAAILAGMQFKNGKSEYALLISLAASLLIFMLSVSKLDQVVQMIKRIQSYVSINSAYITILLKMVGITYIAEFSANLCRDAGYSSIGNQVELVGKLMILTVSMPVLLALLDTIEQFI